MNRLCRLLAGLLLGSGLVRADLILSEFLASNSRQLQDEDGAYSDWIEVHNPGPVSVHLLDWSLTDDASRLTRWTFPSTNLGPGGFLVVFASGKDRRVPGRPLHTNFRLDAAGEYLALVRPDGTTPATEFAPFYPPQLPDVSYGFGFASASRLLLDTNATGRAWVPTDGRFATSWTEPAFEDASWLAATNGIGFETGSGGPPPAPAIALELEPSGYWRLDESTGTTAANLGTAGAAWTGTYMANPVLDQAGPRPPAHPGFEEDNRAVRFGPDAGHVTLGRPLLNHLPAFTLAGWVRPATTRGHRIGLFGQNDAIEFGLIHDDTLQIWTPNGGSVTAGVSLAVDAWQHLAAVGDGSRLRLFLNGDLIAEGGHQTLDYGSSTDVFNIGGGGVFDATGNPFHGAIDEVLCFERALSEGEIARLHQAAVTGEGDGLPARSWFGDLIRTDLQDRMWNQAASAFLRLPFEVENPDDLIRLTLRLRYKDGFVAWLNGREVARANAPETVSWESTAVSERSPGLVRRWVAFDLDDELGWLVPGRNVLAIQGLNHTATHGSFFLQGELEATLRQTGLSGARYFTTPTPGAPNGTGSADMGPLLSQVQCHPALPAQPAPDDPLTVTARVDPAFAPVRAVTLHWRVMYGPLQEMPMLDEGQHGDGAAGDGVYGAILPGGLAAPGQMVRWYVTATDDQERISRWPLFHAPDDSAEYLGTVIRDTTVVSALPVLWQFIENQSAANTRTGTRCSLFHLGEFYDNVRISVHGQSSAGWTKKSYNLDFNRDHRFLYQAGAGRVKDVKLLSNWGDKSRTHNALTHEMAARAGSISHWCFQVRVQRNGQFHSIADLMEDADDRWLERVGRDPEGALYKIYDNLSGTGSAQKKTRRWEDKSDLQTLINNLSESRPLAERARYACDHLDLPQTISYFAALALASSQDHGHKNYFVYRDSRDTGEWMLLPWDVDLTWGRNWLDHAGYFTDTLFQDNVLSFYNPAQQSKGANRYYNLIFQHPEFRAMYLRRLRTLMDTLLMPAGTPPDQLAIERRIREMMDLMDPPGVAVSDADLDFARWGHWGAPTGMRQEAQRMIDLHLPGRRAWLFGNPQATLYGERIPEAQPAGVTLRITDLDFNPVSGNPLEEYVRITNPNAFAVDVSGWNLQGEIEFIFRPGTVIPAGASLHVSPHVASFRNRALSPRGGEGRFVTGPSAGRLPARGGTVALRDTGGRLVEAHTYAGDPTPAQRFLRISELMYHPPVLPGDTFDARDCEYLELVNVSTDTPLNLRGVRFTRGILFTFHDSVLLMPGERVLLVKDAAAFVERYGEGLPVTGVYEGRLDNAGERLTFEDGAGEEVLDFSYSNAWHPLTAGFGFSLTIVDPLAAPEAWNNPDQWRASGRPLGFPGHPDPGHLIPPILINEALAHTTAPGVDAIELFNPTDAPVDIGGWFLTDDFAVPRKYRIPDGTRLPPGDFAVFDDTRFNAPEQGDRRFGLSAWGEEVYVFSGNAQHDLTGYVHGFEFGASANGVSFGRHVTSDGREHFVAQSRTTLGGPNDHPLVGPVIISELMYHPPPLAGENNTRDEYIRLSNLTPEPVPLFDPGHPNHTWRLRDAVRFDFPPDQHLPGGGHLIVVGFDPETDLESLSAFRQVYGLGPDARIVGPFSGRLDNAGETLDLLRPGAPDPDGRVPYLLVERCDYRPGLPWPGNASGTGSSLQRAPSTAFSNDPAHWRGAPAAPAAMLDGDADGMDDVWEIFHGLDPWADDSALDADGDGMSNLEEFIAGTDPQDPTCRLRLEVVSAGSGGIVLEFTAMPGIGYTVIVTEDLAGAAWRKLADVAAEPELRRVLLDVPITGSAFYRVMINGARAERRWQQALGGCRRRGEEPGGREAMGEDCRSRPEEAGGKARWWAAG